MQVLARIEPGARYKSFGFEIFTSGKRSFVVSILQYQTRRKSNDEGLTGEQIEALGYLIGDGISPSKIDRTLANNYRLSTWTYRRTGALGDDDVTDGIVRVARLGTRVVIVVVKYDHIAPHDPVIKSMLESLKIEGV